MIILHALQSVYISDIRSPNYLHPFLNTLKIPKLSHKKRSFGCFGDVEGSEKYGGDYRIMSRKLNFVI